VIAFGLLLLSCASPVSRLPPVTRRPTTEHHVGKVIWLDLATPDPESAKRFYGKLFGWTFYSDPNDAGYVTVYLRDHLIGGIIKPSVADGAQHQAAWLTYLAVRDVDAPEGSPSRTAPRSYPLREPTSIGAASGIRRSGGCGVCVDGVVDRRSTGCLARARPMDLEHRAHTRCADRFRVLSGPLSATRSMSSLRIRALEQVVLESGGYARATLNEIPHEASGLHSRWINFVRVEDAPDTVAKAVALGGRTLVSPHIDRHGGRIAVLADPQGAWFGVMEWPDGDHPKAAK
jgi:predicted enzyme related to lactoylglutathione lyase